MNLLQMLRLHGQSVWLKGVDRGLIVSGQLQQYLDNEVRGVTANFSSIQRSLHAAQYDRDFQAIAHQGDSLSLYQSIVVREMQLAAERIKEVHDQTDGKDGYVNLDLSPPVVSNAESMLTEARRLWQQVGWSNFMLAIPAAPETLLVIQQLIEAGVSVNATQVVSLADYAQVTEAYLSGLEAFTNDAAINKIVSVASVPVSYLDAAMPTVGIAQAKVLYQHYRDFYQNSNSGSLARRWRILAARGAHPQRLAWMLADSGIGARTQLYVESLMGANTVMVLSPSQLAMRYEDTGLREDNRARSRLTEDLEAADQTLVRLSQSGLSLDQIAQQLRIEEKARSQISFQRLLQAIEQKQHAVRYFN